MENKHNCRVCGLWINELPWGNDGNSPTYDICPCCGAKFGYEDCTIKSTKEYRMKWVNGGIVWFYPKQKPKDWNVQEQMKKISNEYK